VRSSEEERNADITDEYYQGRHVVRADLGMLPMRIQHQRPRNVHGVVVVTACRGFLVNGVVIFATLAVVAVDVVVLGTAVRRENRTEVEVRGLVVFSRSV
jgi:hypothetical protein